MKLNEWIENAALVHSISDSKPREEILDGLKKPQ